MFHNNDRSSTIYLNLNIYLNIDATWSDSNTKHHRITEEP